MPMPSQSTVFSCRYQAKPSTPTCVMLPPKQPFLSINAVRAPARPDASAAASPPGPLPTTRTSVSSTTSTVRASSVIFLIPAGSFDVGPPHFQCCADKGMCGAQSLADLRGNCNHVCLFKNPKLPSCFQQPTSQFGYTRGHTG